MIFLKALGYVFLGGVVMGIGWLWTSYINWMVSVDSPWPFICTMAVCMFLIGIVIEIGVDMDKSSKVDSEHEDTDKDSPSPR